MRKTTSKNQKIPNGMGVHGFMNLPLLLECGNVLEMKPLFITIEKFTKNEKPADGETSLVN